MKKLATINPLVLGATLATLTLCGCQTQKPRSSGSTLLLTQSGVIQKDLKPQKDLKLSLPLETATKPSTQAPTEDKVSEKDSKNPAQVNTSIKNTSVLGQRRVIDVGNQPIRGYSNLEVYTEIPVPTAYSPARIISSNGGTTLIPATPTQVERVRIGPNARISGFVDYGPTINIPVRTKDGVKYIQQKSSMPMPIIDRISVTYE
jgi:hypothetical protein